MPTQITTQITTPARRIRTQIRISRVSVEKTGRNLIVKLPIAAARYLNIENVNELYAVPINGVVQLSGFQPNLTIPVTNIGAEDFVEQLNKQ